MWTRKALIQRGWAMLAGLAGLALLAAIGAASPRGGDGDGDPAPPAVEAPREAPPTRTILPALVSDRDAVRKLAAGPRTADGAWPRNAVRWGPAPYAPRVAPGQETPPANDAKEPSGAAKERERPAPPPPCQLRRPAPETPAETATEAKKPGVQPVDVAVPGRDPTWAAPVTLEGVPNMARITPALYRGAQPTPAGFENLHNMGIKTVVSFRQFNSDREDIGDLPLQYERIGFNALKIDPDDVVRFLRIVTDPDRQPVFIHCWHGVDRTGTMAAVYRIVVQGWTREAAVREFVDGFDMHDKVYKNLIHFVRTANLDALRRRAELPAPPVPAPDA